MSIGKQVISKVAAVAAAGFLSTAAQAYYGAPDYVYLRSANHAGTGCPAGSVAANLSYDGRALTVLSDSFVAQAGPGLPLSESRKNCSLAVDLAYPSGWSFAVVDAEYRGYVLLEPGVTATQSASYYFQGQSQTARMQTTMQGPTSRDYVLRDTLGLSGVVWSPCGLQRALVVNAQVRVDNSRARNNRGLITTDSLDGSSLLRFGLAWRRCW